MDTSKIKTLDQVSDAIDAVEDARAVKNLSAKDKAALEKTAVTLRNIERAIIKSVQGEMVDTLKSNTKALEDLTDQINKSAKKLDKLTDTLEKTCKAVEGLINVIVTAVGAGLL
ncbi:MAG: hypothetical protein QM726_20880 [Chitinophagaceae bacterium]